MINCLFYSLKMRNKLHFCQSVLSLDEPLRQETYIWMVGNMFNPKNKQAHQSDCSKLCICIPAFMDLICHWDSPNQLSVKPSVQIEDHRGGAVTPLFFNYIICIMKRTPEIGERARTENCNQIITGNWTWWGDVISAENEKLGKTQA